MLGVGEERRGSRAICHTAPVAVAVRDGRMPRWKKTSREGGIQRAPREEEEEEREEDESSGANPACVGRAGTGEVSV